ncbi:MAG: alpha/beta fold hydrolase [bacterium]|nr:alpha/beta fold hydrolase [bacterium]
MQQVVIIGGGTTFDTYEGYISFLKTKEISLDKLRPSKEWKASLAEELGKNFEVLVPKMPNVTNARYKEWKIWFERILPLLLNKKIILIGHSMGGIFLAKYLSQNKIPKNIIATILVAAPFEENNLGELLGSFKLPASLSKLARQGGSIFLIQSEDDPVVPVEHVKKYQQRLPNSKLMLFSDRGHFKQETFPELTTLIKTLKA